MLRFTTRRASTQLSKCVLNSHTLLWARTVAPLNIPRCMALLSQVGIGGSEHGCLRGRLSVKPLSICSIVALAEGHQTEALLSGSITVCGKVYDFNRLREQKHGPSAILSNPHCIGCVGGMHEHTKRLPNEKSDCWLD